MNEAELKRLYDRLKPLETKTMTVSAPPPRTNRFGSPLKLSEVHWINPRCAVQPTATVTVVSVHEETPSEEESKMRLVPYAAALVLLTATAACGDDHGNRPASTQGQGTTPF
jgi:hypothetical protein